MAKGRMEISGLGVAIATAGAFLIYVGIKNVPIQQGLRDITAGDLPKGPTKVSDQGAGAPAVTAARAALSTGGGGGGGGISQIGDGGGGLASAAMAYLGVPYQWGGETRRGMDCSGLVKRAFADIGISSPRTTYTQQAWNALTGVSAGGARSGDLVFWPGHVAIYLGGGKVVHAPRPGKVVRVESVNSAGPAGTRATYKRYIGKRRTVSI